MHHIEYIAGGNMNIYLVLLTIFNIYSDKGNSAVFVASFINLLINFNCQSLKPYFAKAIVL